MKIWNIKFDGFLAFEEGPITLIDSSHTRNTFLDIMKIKSSYHLSHFKSVEDENQK